MSTVETAVGRFVWHDHMSSDPEAARSFYEQLLGWETEIASMGEFDYPMIKVGEKSHGGFGPAQGGAPAHWLGYVLVDDVDEAVLRVEAAAGRVLSPAMDIPNIGRWAVIADPQGAVVSLFAAAGGPTAGEGVFVWDELLTTDVDAAKQFYTEVVGWESRDQDMGDFSYTLFSSGGTDRAGCMNIPPQAEGTPPNWMTYLGTDDVDATAEKAKSLGANIMMEPFDVPTVGRLAIIADPTGAVVGLYKPAQS